MPKVAQIDTERLLTIVSKDTEMFKYRVQETESLSTKYTPG